MNPKFSSDSSDRIHMPEMLFGYFVGPFGGMLASGIFASILQNYFTDVLKLNLTFLTGLQLFSTFLIIASNLIIGQLIDHTHALTGKARPWILFSALGLTITTILLFFVPFQGKARMIWIAAAYLLYYACASPVYTTANSTLVSVSTRNSKDRGLLASLVNIASLGVMGVGSMIFPVLVSFALKENQHLWLLTFTGIGLFSGFTVFLQYRFTRERVTEEMLSPVRRMAQEGLSSARKGAEEGFSSKNKEDEKVLSSARKKTASAPAVPLKEQLSAVMTSGVFWITIVFFIGFQWSGALKNGSMTFFCKWVLNNRFFGSSDAWGASQSILSICGAVPMAVAAVFVVPLSNRFGKRNLCFAGMAIGVIGGLLAGLGNGEIIPVAIGVALKCLGSSPACYLILAMLSDVIDHIEYQHSIRAEGLVMSLYGSIMCGGSAICNAIFSFLLRQAGYNQNADPALGLLAQTASVKAVISGSYIWAETICYAVCAVLILFWNIEKNLSAEQEAISERRHLQPQQK